MSYSYFPGSDMRMNRAIYRSANRYARGSRLLSAMQSYSRSKGYSLSAGRARAAGRAYIQYRRAMSRAY